MPARYIPLAGTFLEAREVGMWFQHQARRHIRSDSAAASLHRHKGRRTPRSAMRERQTPGSTLLDPNNRAANPQSLSPYTVVTSFHFNIRTLNDIRSGAC